MIYDPLTGKFSTPPKPVKSQMNTRLQPTVTIGGAPASYRPVETMQPTVTIGGVPAGYTRTVTPNFRTGEGIPGTPAFQQPSEPNFITGQGTGAPAPAPTVTPVLPSPRTASSYDAASDTILAQTLSSYGLSGVAATIAKIRGDYPEITSEQLLTLLKNDARYNAEYLKRFAGNVKLKAAGLPTIADDEYLKAEDEYKKIFTAYGATSLANRDYYATLIGNRMDAVDVTDRMNLGYARLQAMPEIKDAFRTFFSAATEGDILAAILDPETQLPILQKKITAAEIGGAALKQGLQTSLVRANELQGAGITQATAMAGYSTIAQGMTDFEKILELNTGRDVKATDVQARLEESRLLKSAKAIKEEQAAVGVELGRFGGSAGRFASKDRATGLV